MRAPDTLLSLVDRFSDNRDAYKRGAYNETQLRREFIDPLFEALGWDVQNKLSYAEAYKDVIHEDAIKVGVLTKAPDYCFRIGGARKFFVEAKKPSVDIKGDPGPAFQLRRYAWSSKLPLSILTDFEEFAVYDCRVRPGPNDKPSLGRILYLTYLEYPAQWDELASIFSRDAVLKGSFDRYAESKKGKRGTAEVDDAFLTDIETWRVLLAKNLAQRNPRLTTRQLNSAVQQTLDRIIFLRICEDRGAEDYGRLQGLLNAGRVYSRLGELFQRADDRYNSGLFHFRREKDRSENADETTLGLHVDDEPLHGIIRELYYPNSPYEFSVLPAQILGQVYEQFLGSVIRLTAGHHAVVEQKPEVKKAGGVYYTPSFVVDYIVDHTVGELLSGKNPKLVSRLKILDPACGSGSFLLGAYQRLLDWHTEWYLEDGAEKHRKELYQGPGGNWRLSTAEKKRILLANIYGVDIDPQAVEVTKLSLLLKVLEGDSAETLQHQFWFLHDRALPDLGRNIKCGNSLIEPDFYADQQIDLLSDDERYATNAFDWHVEFPDICGPTSGGFDAVIGNPPYVLLEGEFRNDGQLRYFRSHFACASYKLDTYHLFIERAILLTRKTGRCAMITPANFLTNNYLAELRRFLLTASSIDHIVVIDKGVFRGVSVDNAVFVVTRSGTPSETFPVIHSRARNNRFEPTSEVPISRVRALADTHVLFTGTGGKKLQNVLERVTPASTALGEIADVNFGKQLRDRTKYVRDVIEVPSTRVPERYRPCYTGGDVGRYRVRWGHLACLDEEIARRGGCWDPDKQDARNKLLTKQIGKHPEFGLDPKGFQCLNTIFMVNVRDTAFDPLFVLGILNSTLLRAIWRDRYYDQRRTFPKIKGSYLKELPVFAVDRCSAAQRGMCDEIVRAVQRVIELHDALDVTGTEQEQAVLSRQVAATESRIDELVYELYGLSDTEVQPIEDVARS